MNTIENILKENYKGAGSTTENEITAYIIRNNNQLVERKIKATKKFSYGKGTYIIKSDCVYRKTINRKLQGVIVYREGNPNPYNFDTLPNLGLKAKELSRIYGEDLFYMLVKIQSENRMFYMLMIHVAVMFMTALMFFKIWF